MEAFISGAIGAAANINGRGPVYWCIQSCVQWETISDATQCGGALLVIK